MSVIVRPSRCLFWLCAGFGGALVATAMVVGFGTPERFAFGRLGAVASLIGAVALARPFARVPHLFGAFPQTHSKALLHGFGTAHRLDISGLGQLRLTVQQEMGAVAPAGAAPPADPSGPLDEGVAVTLLPGATVWPVCMLLRLRTAVGKTVALGVLPDSVSPADFRALSVAVRSLAQGTRDTATKIL